MKNILLYPIKFIVEQSENSWNEKKIRFENCRCYLLHFYDGNS